MDRKTPLTVRLDPAVHDAFVAACEAAGLEQGVAARQVLTLFTRDLEASGGYVGALHRMTFQQDVSHRPQQG